jgi:hypothetical protein
MAALTQANLGGRTIELTQNLSSVHVHDAFDFNDQRTMCYFQM